jgi:hypothetical protein
MIRLALITVCISSFLPIKVMAIELSEIAWMGSTESANHEWIELYSLEAIDVTGWTISDGNNLEIKLTGTISAGDFAVLERTSDASAPGTAWQIYTGSLVNTGATLSLYDAAGAVVDRVSGGSDWQQIGGDNNTKATAQLSSNGWITADPTPGQRSTGIAQVSEDNNDDSDTEESDDTNSNPTTTTSSGSSNSRSSSAAESIELTLPGITLQLAATAPKTTYVNQPTTFAVQPSGVGNTIASSLSYTWSFGDTNTATGQTVNHAFSHPGNYVVVVEAHYKRQIQRTRHDIVVLPVSLALTEHPSGNLAIQNNSQTEIDLAGYRLVGNKSFTIPDHTILLPKSEIVVPHSKFQTGSVAQMVALYDHAQHQAAVHLPSHLSTGRTIAAAAPTNDSRDRRDTAPAPTPRISAIDDSPRYTFASANTNQPTPPIGQPVTAPANNPNPQLAAAGHATLPANWPQYAFIGVLLLGVMAVYLIPRIDTDRGPLG